MQRHRLAGVATLERRARQLPLSEAVAPLHPVPLLQACNRLLRHQSAVPLIHSGAAIAACCLIQRESLNPGRPWQGRFF